jgi:release factor glutamine methyltransferase
MTHPLNQIKASRQVLDRSQKERFPYRMRVSGMNIVVRPKVFSPKHFYGWRVFAKHLPNVKGKSVLEIGTGTAVTALLFAKRGAQKVVAVDISPFAVKNAKENVRLNRLHNIEIRRSNIFSGIKKNERFDVIYWNTPFMYMPSKYHYRSVLERGLFDPGYKITDRFLREAKQHINLNGSILFGTGNFGDIPRFLKMAKKNGYKVRRIAREKSTEINPVIFELYELKSL